MNDDSRTFLIMTPKRFPRVLPFLPEVRELPPSFGVGQKYSQSGPGEKSLTQKYLQTHYPKESWTHVYSVVPAENIVGNGGAGVYLQYPGGREDQISLTPAYTP